MRSWSSFACRQGSLPGTRLPIRGKLDYLACTEEICVPEKARSRARPDGGRGGGRPQCRDRRATGRRCRGRSGSEGAFRDNRTASSGSPIPLPASLPVSDAYFFPLTDGAIDYSAPQSVSRSGDTLIVETEAGSGSAGLGSKACCRLGERRRTRA